MSLVLNVEILGEFKNLTAATKGAQTSLNGLNKTTASISKKMTGALAAIGLGFSLRTVINELQEAGKAAVEDNKAQVLLADTLRKTTNATDEQIKSVEKYISQTELRTQILDDKLRPAMAIALRSTGDLTKAQDLLNLAVDVSVGTGKDLEIVTKSIARAYDGNYTGLQKLVPGISKGSDALDQLRAKFDGAAEAAAKTDPYMQMTVIFNDMQERIGMALLPTLNQFSTWLSTPEGQEKLQGIVDLTVAMLGKFTDLANFVIDNKDTIIAWGGVIGGVALAIKGVNVAMGIYNGLKTATLATQAALTAGFTAMGVSAGTAAAAVNGLFAALKLIGAVAAEIALILSIPGSSAVGAEKQPKPTIAPLAPGTAPLVPTTKVPTAPTSSIGKFIGTTNNTTINVQSTQSAQDIAAVLQRSQKTNGTTVFRGL